MTEIIERGAMHFRVPVDVYNDVMRKHYFEGNKAKVVDLAMTLVPQPPEEVEKFFQKGGVLEHFRLCLPYHVMMKIATGEYSLTESEKGIGIKKNSPDERKQIVKETIEWVRSEHEDDEGWDIRDHVDLNGLFLDLEKEEVAPEPVKKIPCTNHESRSYGWLSPDGKYYECEGYQHRDLAHDLWMAGIVILKGYKPGDPIPWDLKIEDEMLKKLGWVKVSLNRRISSYSHSLTRKQVDFIYDYLKYNNEATLEYNGMDFDKHETLEENFAGLLAYLDEMDELP